MAMEQFKAPALPLAPTQYDRTYLDQLNNILRQYFTQLDSLTPNQAFTYRANKYILNIDGAATAAEGEILWNPTDQTANLGLADGVTNQIGQETYARVQNNTGTTILNGTVVGFAGATANALFVKPFLADASDPALYALGVMTHDLSPGERGYCTVFGFVRDLNTSAFVAGDVLYASPTVAGGLTKTKPTAPNDVIPIATCIVSDTTTGVVFVRPIIEQTQYYGSFSATVNQTPAAINTAYAVVLDVTDISNGVVLGTPASRVVVPQSGLYSLSANLQIGSTSASAKNMWCWFRKNGVDLPNSAHLVTSDVNNGFTYLAHTYTVSLVANDYVEVMYAVDNTAMFLNAVAATAFAPAAPAVQFSVTQEQQ